MCIENVINEDPPKPQRGDTSVASKHHAAPLGLGRIERMACCYKHGAPLELSSAGRHADMQSFKAQPGGFRQRRGRVSVPYRALVSRRA